MPAKNTETRTTTEFTSEGLMFDVEDYGRQCRVTSSAFVISRLAPPPDVVPNALDALILTEHVQLRVLDEGINCFSGCSPDSCAGIAPMIVELWARTTRMSYNSQSALLSASSTSAMKFNPHHALLLDPWAGDSRPFSQN